MKKLMGTIVFLSALCAIGTAAHAATGDVVGNVYSTDIRAFINGVEVPSYSIGGKTAVAVEDVLVYGAYMYNNDVRTLLIRDMSPQNLVGGKTANYGSIGEVVGKIYETDIKTYVYDELMPAYAIGGKTAVAIEDLGDDGVFSDIGGKYIWDPNERTISLEFMYNSNFEISSILRSRGVDMYINNGKVSLEKNLFDGGAISMNWANPQPVSWVIPLEFEMKPKMYNVIGFNFKKPMYIFMSDESGKMSLGADITSFNYIASDILKSSINEADITPYTRDEIIDFYIEHSMCTVKQRVDTDGYTFAYMTGPTTHGSTEHLMLAREDGTYHDYAWDFESVSRWGTKKFDNVRVGKKSVTFRYDTDYEIDLKTGIITKQGETAESKYPAIPNTGRKHYVIYREGYRDDRIELAEFDTDAKSLALNENKLGIAEPESYKHDIKYYLDGDKWVEFERGYERVSNNAAEVLESDIDVIKNGTHIVLFGILQ